MKKDREKNKKYSNITDATIMGSTSEESALHARANREHFSSLPRLEEISKGNTDMRDIQKQVLDARNLLNQLNANGIDGDSALGVSFTTGAILGGGFAASGLAGMAVLGGLVAGSALAILGDFSASKMEEKLENAKAYYSQVEAAVKKADVMVDNLRSVEKMADLFTRQITKFDALFFSLSIEVIATMKKHNYDASRYTQKEKDQLCVTFSTLSSLSTLLKVSIMDKHQKLNEKAKKALNLMRDQMGSLENGNYSLGGIRFRQAQLEDLRDDDKTS